MINFDDTLKVGYLKKPHGIKGEITLIFDRSSYADIDTELYFLDIDGILVPFFLEEITFISDTTCRVKFMDIEDETVALRYSNISVYVPRDKVSAHSSDNEYDWSFFIGFSIVEENGNRLGTIEDVDSDTINVLFIVKDGEKEILIPATEDFIVYLDDEQKQICMKLPEGLLDIE